MKAKSGIPSRVEDLLASSDVKELLSVFSEKYLADASDLVLLWRDRDGGLYLSATPLDTLTLLGLLGWALRARPVLPEDGGENGKKQ